MGLGVTISKQSLRNLGNIRSSIFIVDCLNATRTSNSRNHSVPQFLHLKPQDHGFGAHCGHRLRGIRSSSSQLHLRKSTLRFSLVFVIVVFRYRVDSQIRRLGFLFLELDLCSAHLLQQPILVAQRHQLELPEEVLR